MSRFPSDYEEFIHKSRYARWVEELGRRETWPETVDRYMNFMEVPEEIRDSILNFEVMPSMRALMTAGPALDRDNTAGFNCSFLPVDHLRSFDEAMYILLCGSGVGFSVEKKFANRLPYVENLSTKLTHVVVEDSKEGWADATRQVIEALYAGHTVTWDVSKVRPEGARLKTFGGRASGPEPLVSLFQFLCKTISLARGRQLKPIECHDIMCKIGEIVVVGGVRRSAMISLSDLDDQEMANAKSGEWWVEHPHRRLANNSAVYETEPEIDTFLSEWASLVASKSGERGIFSRAASQRQAAKFDRDASFLFGTNPCSEIILRPYQFCNLTEVVVRPEDTLADLTRKVEHATILGTYQARLTNFPYLRDIWRENTEAERLLGVSLTGIMDHPQMSSSDYTLASWLQALRVCARKVNEIWAEKLGIKSSASITCVKPSGTVSQLVNSASGIHARHSKYYIRTVRGDNKDPLTQFMKDQGIPNEPCVMSPEITTVFSFPMEAPDGAVTRNDMTAIEQLELWMLYQEHWCEHKPSVTISVRDEEWIQVAQWVFENFRNISGISFLPHDDHTYQQAPYQEITYYEYVALKDKQPAKINWDKFAGYEVEDNTVAMQTLACVAGVCEI